MPMVPPAPVRFSITICWPIARDTDSPTTRATKSSPPPGASGTMKRTGRLGHVVSVAPCARAASGPCGAWAISPSSAMPAAAARLINVRRSILGNSSSPSCSLNLFSTLLALARSSRFHPLFQYLRPVNLPENPVGKVRGRSARAAVAHAAIVRARAWVSPARLRLQVAGAVAAPGLLGAVEDIASPGSKRRGSRRPGASRRRTAGRELDRALTLSRPRLRIRTRNSSMILTRPLFARSSWLALSRALHQPFERRTHGTLDIVVADIMTTPNAQLSGNALHCHEAFAGIERRGGLHHQI